MKDILNLDNTTEIFAFACSVNEYYKQAQNIIKTLEEDFKINSKSAKKQLLEEELERFKAGIEVIEVLTDMTKEGLKRIKK